MTIKKISDEPRYCNHREHNPPSMMVLKPGTYEHTCPGFGKKTVLVSNGIYCVAEHKVKL
jgi:hypothetical protein